MLLRNLRDKSQKLKEKTFLFSQCKKNFSLVMIDEANQKIKVENNKKKKKKNIN